ncbi:hypothetical protein [Helicobacter burdigaliensis]|uniref:hypothetical protein n=1 Tax=Helicobacter burdigaliensis TaxID=2315334 RepID=UPI001300BB3F|nr:hypothetical protein [Helicobacter burdigaliensis]
MQKCDTCMEARGRKGDVPPPIKGARRGEKHFCEKGKERFTLLKAFCKYSRAVAKWRGAFLHCTAFVDNASLVWGFERTLVSFIAKGNSLPLRSQNK